MASSSSFAYNPIMLHSHTRRFEHPSTPLKSFPYLEWTLRLRTNKRTIDIFNRSYYISSNLFCVLWFFSFSVLLAPVCHSRSSFQITLRHFNRLQAQQHIIYIYVQNPLANMRCHTHTQFRSVLQFPCSSLLIKWYHTFITITIMKTWTETNDQNDK